MSYCKHACGHAWGGSQGPFGHKKCFQGRLVHMCSRHLNAKAFFNKIWRGAGMEIEEEGGPTNPPRIQSPITEYHIAEGRDVKPSKCERRPIRPGCYIEVPPAVCCNLLLIKRPCRRRKSTDIKVCQCIWTCVCFCCNNSRGSHNLREQGGLPHSTRGGTHLVMSSRGMQILTGCGIWCCCHIRAVRGTCAT